MDSSDGQWKQFFPSSVLFLYIELCFLFCFSFLSSYQFGNDNWTIAHRRGLSLTLILYWCMSRINKAWGRNSLFFLIFASNCTIHYLHERTYHSLPKPSFLVFLILVTTIVLPTVCVYAERFPFVFFLKVSLPLNLFCLLDTILICYCYSPRYCFLLFGSVQWLPNGNPCIFLESH